MLNIEIRNTFYTHTHTHTGIKHLLNIYCKLIILFLLCIYYFNVLYIFIYY